MEEKAEEALITAPQINFSFCGGSVRSRAASSCKKEIVLPQTAKTSVC